MNAAAVLRCPLCGGTCQSLMRSLESGLPECPGEAGHRFQAPANDNEPPVTGTKIECRLGTWKMGRCPHRSCGIAGECTASTPGNDNQPGLQFTSEHLAAAKRYPPGRMLP